MLKNVKYFTITKILRTFAIENKKIENMEKQEKQLKIKKIVYWVYPFYGNRHTMPYGKLKVTDGETTKTCYTKGDTLDDCNRYGCQYITFNRKPYRVVTFLEGNVEKLRLEPIKK